MTITGVKHKKCAKCRNNALLLPKNKGLCLSCVEGRVVVNSVPREYEPNPHTPPNWKCGCKLCKPSVADKALEFAREAHNGQDRKYTGEPYIVHPQEVYCIVHDVGGTDDMLAAALLHDTVEDTSVTLSDIREEFGPDIAGLVADLTDVSKPEDGNRAVRKEIDRQHTAQASPEAKTIKLADLISNSVSIVQHDPSFAKVYMKEKAALLEVLTEGNTHLHARASEQVKKFNESLQT